MGNDLVVTRLIRLNADPSRVWDLLIQPALSKHYMYDMEVQSDWVVGSEMRWSGFYDGKPVARHGVLLEMMPSRTLKYSLFDPYSGRDDKPENYVHVCYKVVPIPGGTELAITLSNFNGNEMRAQLAAEEWDFNIIPRLKNFAEHQGMYAGTIL